MKTKEEKREEAKLRQKKYDSLSLKEKVSLCKKRRGKSLAEKTRLHKLLKEEYKRKEGKRKKR